MIDWSERLCKLISISEWKDVIETIATNKDEVILAITMYKEMQERSAAIKAWEASKKEEIPY